MESRIEDILSATIGGESYNKPSESRIETLLINLKEQIDDKVDKVSGKGLSTNDFTTAEKTKLDDLAEIKSIGTGLALDDSTGELVATGGSGGGGTLDYTELINKPQINSVILSGNKSLSDLGITYESETAVSGGTTLSLVTTGEKYAWNNKQSAIDDLSTIRSGAALGTTAVQPETGKGLSTNDYTTAEKTKLAGVAEGADVNEIEGVKVNNTTINPDANKVVNITVPTTAADVSALPSSTKYAAALSLTINSSTFVMTGQLKDQDGNNLGIAQTIDLPLESVVVGGSYDDTTKKVVLTLQNGNTVEFSVADLVAGLQTELSATNKLNPAYIDYDSTHRAVSDTEKSTWNDKQNALTTEQLAAVNSGIDSTKVGQIDTNADNETIDRTALVELVDSGDKNKLINSIPDGEAFGVSFVKNADETVTVSGTASGGNAQRRVMTISAEDAQKYNGMVLSGCPAGGSSSTYRLIFQRDSSPYTIYSSDTGEGVVIQDVPDVQCRIFIVVYDGTSVDFTFKPMICTKAAWDISQEYQPYRPSYTELYEMVKDLQTQLNNQ